MRWPTVRAARGSFALLAALLAAGCGGGESDALLGPRLLAVPNVVGMTQDDAHCRLAAAGWRWHTGGEPRSRERTGGCSRGRSLVVTSHAARIVEQAPLAGTRAPHRTVVEIEASCGIGDPCR